MIEGMAGEGQGLQADDSELDLAADGTASAVVRIERFADQGRCVAHIDGRVVFVRFALPGELVRVVLDEPHRRADRFWTGEVTDVLEASPLRVAPAWPLAGPLAQGGGVGGADLVHVSLEGQHQWKKFVIDDQMKRLGGLSTDVEVASFETDADDGDGTGLAWRTRIDLIADDAGKPSMRRRGSHVRVPLESMPLATEAIQRVADRWRLWNGGFAPGARIRLTAPQPRVIDGVRQPEPVESGNYAVLVNGELVHGKAIVQETLAGVPLVPRPLTFEVQASGFWQVHRAAPRALVNYVLESVNQRFSAAPAVMWDLYSGSGLFTAALGAYANRGGAGMMSIEGAPGAVASARRNLKAAGLSGVDVRKGDVARVLRSVPKKLAHPDAVVLDPPRAGAKRQVCEAIASSGASAVVYIACDPTSLARDSKTLARLGYRLDSIKAFDIYPMTHHVETVAVFLQA